MPTMTPNVVVDIGNTRIKWGRCDLFDVPPDESASLRPDDPPAWERQLAEWRLTGVRWALASVHPERLEHFRRWTETRGDSALVIDNYRQLSLKVDMPYPERVGIDRLLNALAFLPHLPAGTPGVVIDVGTAVTIDLLDEEHVFRGGAILPGPRLMFESLHRQTAKLPLVQTHAVPAASIPGKTTEEAMTAGIAASQVGAVEYLVREYAHISRVQPRVMMTGGAVGALFGHKFEGVAWSATDPLLTLRGIQLAAEALP
jgi:type III pantothenate kinase